MINEYRIPTESTFEHFFSIRNTFEIEVKFQFPKLNFGEHLPEAHRGYWVRSIVNKIIIKLKL